jgi:multiple sugar transport system ATP-binding protein
MVFQSYALYPYMTAFDNVAFALKLRGMSKTEIDTRMKEAAGILGILELLARKPKDMSGGQRQRVLVGRAIVRHPRVFLFAEPDSNLDAKLREQTRREIARLHQQLSATMLYVTHDQVEAMTLGDRIVLLEGGYVKQINTPMNLYERPKNRFVAGFIGSPSMNMLPRAIVAGPGVTGVKFLAEDDAFSIALSGEWAQRLAGDGARAVMMGVRPEDIDIAPDGSLPLGTGAVRVKLDVVEPLGSEAFPSARVDAKEITVRMSPRDYRRRRARWS